MSLHAPSVSDLRQQVHDAARRARVAARTLATLNTETKDRALHAAADALLARMDEILASNSEDLEAARAAGTPAAMLDRLALNPARVEGIAQGLRQVAGLPDPIGELIRGRTLPNGLQLRQQRVPLGVVGIVYEGRPNVTVDAAVRLRCTPTPHWCSRCEPRCSPSRCPRTRCSCCPPTTVPASPI